MPLFRAISQRWKNFWPWSKRTSNNPDATPDEASPQHAAREHLRKLTADLLHLEITTIVQPKIVSTKMANARCALLDLATTYRQELARQQIPAPSDLDLLGGYDAFQRIQQWARHGIDLRTSSPLELTAVAPADLVRLYEIQDKALHIVGLFRALQQRQAEFWDNAYSRAEIENTPRPFPLTPDEMMLIRKFWELGLEEIAMQTVIQVDGDVITRIQPAALVASAQPLRDLHKEGLQISVAFWHELVGTVEVLVGLITRSVSR